MTVSALLTELRARDIRVWADEGQLRCNAPSGALTPELREQLRERKNEILEFLQSAELLARQQRAIVPLQPAGKRVPVYAVAGHNGDVFCYRALARRLGDDQPFYGLQPPGLDGKSAPLARVEEIAAYFAEQIRSFQPQGPCIVAGFCAGGTIAFELARQLVARGTPVSFLALFGSPYAAWFRRLPQFRQSVVERIQQAVNHLHALGPISWGERRLYLAQKMRLRETESESERDSEIDPVLVMRARLEKITIDAIRGHTPGFFAGRLVLFLPNGKWRRSSTSPLRWRKVAREAEEYVGPEDCEYSSMLLEPFAPVFAAFFAKCCENYARLPSS